MAYIAHYIYKWLISVFLLFKNSIWQNVENVCPVKYAVSWHCYLLLGNVV